MKENYTGELILSFLIIFINIFCLKEWKTHLDNDFVRVNKIKKNELNFILIISLLCLIIYSLFLYNFKSNFAILNAISTIAFLLSNYFSYRRSILQFFSLLIYEFAYMSLWGLSVSNGEICSLVLFTGGILEVIYDIMGIIKWKKISRLQTSIKCKTYYCLK